VASPIPELAPVTATHLAAEVERAHAPRAYYPPVLTADGSPVDNGQGLTIRSVPSFFFWGYGAQIRVGQECNDGRWVAYLLSKTTFARAAETG